MAVNAVVWSVKLDVAYSARVELTFFSLGKSMAKAACRVGHECVDYTHADLRRQWPTTAGPPRTSRVRGATGAGASSSGRDGESAAIESKCSIATSQLLPHCSTTSCTYQRAAGLGTDGRRRGGRANVGEEQGPAEANRVLP